MKLAVTKQNGAQIATKRINTTRRIVKKCTWNIDILQNYKRKTKCMGIDTINKKWRVINI